MIQAFERVSHEFIWYVLDAFGFDANFMNLNRGLYKSARSRIMMNGLISESFPLHSSITQGCPLSMFLFCLVIEPLIQALNAELKSLEINGESHRVLAYADDVNILINNKQDLSQVELILTAYEKASNAKVSCQICNSSFR